MNLVDTLVIVPVGIDDAPALHAMQMIAFEPEGLASRSRAIPPLQETVDDIREHIRTATVLKALDGEQLLGAVRGIVSDGSCLIRVLVVAPRAQGRGVGGRLLAAIEAAHPRVERFDLTTNMLMEGNVRFYLSHGYDIVEQVQHSPTIRLAFMRKLRGPAARAAETGAP